MAMGQNKLPESDILDEKSLSEKKGSSLKMGARLCAPKRWEDDTKRAVDLDQLVSSGSFEP